MDTKDTRVDSATHSGEGRAGVATTNAEARFKHACWLLMAFFTNRYLMSNAHGRWDGAEKAEMHRRLTQYMVAAWRGDMDPEDVLMIDADYKRVHNATRELTDNLDEQIGFPLKSRPDYDKLAPLFFERFYALATTALTTTAQPYIQGTSPCMLTIPQSMPLTSWHPSLMLPKPLTGSVATKPNSAPMS